MATEPFTTIGGCDCCGSENVATAATSDIAGNTAVLCRYCFESMAGDTIQRRKRHVPDATEFHRTLAFQANFLAGELRRAVLAAPPALREAGPFRTARDLDRADLEEVASLLQHLMYMNEDGEWEPDQEVGGGDLVEAVGELLGRLGMVPPDPEDAEEGDE